MNDYITHTVNLQPLAIKLDDALSRGDLDEANMIRIDMSVHLRKLGVWLFEKGVENERV